MNSRNQTSALHGIAIVGMAGRFPGAPNVDQFWRNQRDGVESIGHFSEGELELSNARELAAQPGYVKAHSILEDPGQFDAAFFGMHPREAEVTDPQQRMFLECCWEAIEEAGYDPLRYPGSIGVYAGASTSTYFLSEVCKTRKFIEDYVHGYQVAGYPYLMGSALDFLATRVAYKLNLRGPALTLQTGCSTSLVAVCQACQSLEAYVCDMALAGGVSITFPQKRGYFYQEGGMASPDGHCRTFDERAQGTVFGSGCAAVLLKRLEDARADGDHIYGVIRGYALNNDGSAKAGYTAPGTSGQAQVIAMAHASAGVGPESISYIEAHGTGTPLGDPIEVAALTQVFRAKTQRGNYCAIGTCKTNVGHLDIAAGITGLIHTVQALRHRQLPPTLNFERPNPNLNLESSPFYVNTQLREWESTGEARRAGVSAFGVGGTNAHVIVEEAPASQSQPSSSPAHLLVLSARTASALEAATVRLATHLRDHAEQDIAAAAYTLQVGRRAFDFRRALVCKDREDAIAALDSREPGRVATRSQRSERPSVCFLFPGQGAQRTGMCRELYAIEPVFREHLDRCAGILEPVLALDLRKALYPAQQDHEAEERLNETALAQPAIFSIEYALAQLWMSWGVRPQAMAGHSVGEFVAACLAGVFSLEDALGLVAARGRMMQDLPRGAMLSVRLAESEIAPLLDGRLSFAASNGPKLSVVAGPFEAIEELERSLGDEVPHRRLATSHAFHSSMVDPIVEPLLTCLKRVKLNAPSLPWVSTLTGKWMTNADATDPHYWAKHCRQPVRFSAAVTELLNDSGRLLIEVGPGSTLTTLARQHMAVGSNALVTASLGETGKRSEYETMLDALGKLWLAGVEPDWEAVRGGERRQRASLPTYPFERRHYWFQPESAAPEALGEATKTENEENPLVESDSRVQRVRAELANLFEELSGAELGGTDPSATFLELGFDSLFLTQVAQGIQNRYKIKITFRQLLDEYSSLGALADLLDRQLPPDAPAAPEVERPKVQPAATAPSGSIERIIEEQLQAFSRLAAQQLEMLRNPTAAAMPATAQVRAFEAEAPSKEFKPFGPYKPVQKGQTGGVTAQQERAIAELTERYTALTAGSKRHTQEHRAHLADPRVVSGFRSQWKELVYPIVTVRSEGSKLWDLDGNQYIDILNGFGPTVFGHRPEFVTRAVARQLEEGFEIGPQTPLAGQVAKTICEFTGMDRATFCNTGSEAVMAALRVARTVTGRKKVVFFSGAYHGMFDEVLVKGIRKGDSVRAVPIAPGIPQEKAENMFVLDYGTDESLAWIRQHAGELAAILVEPVQSRHPALQPVAFLRELREITERSQTALIFDEVVTGFRVHPGGCQALFNIRADLATYGKVLGGGLPIGVLAGKAEFMDALDGGAWRFGDDSSPEKGVTFFAGTFVRHPLALAATAAVLDHLKEQGPALQERLGERTTSLVSRLNEFLSRSGVSIHIESFASIFYFSFPLDLHFGSLFYHFMRSKGVHVLEGFPCFLTTAHSDADIEHVARAFEDSIREMQAGGLLPAAIERPATAAGEATLTEAPLTEAQREIWLSAQLGDEASCAFNESFTLDLQGGLNQPALLGALDEIVSRHDALRATFPPEGGTARFAAALTLDIPFLDLSALPEPERRARVATLLQEDARTAFDLANGPLIRAVLVRVTAEHHLLIVTAHHIVCDGWSTNVLLDELGHIYTAKCTGANAGLPRPMRFVDYALKQAMHSFEQQEAETYWLKQFADLPHSLELPTDRPRGSMKSSAGATCRKNLDAVTLGRIKKAGSRKGCTLFATLLGGFQTLLHRLSGQDDIVVGVPAAAQSLLDGETLVGHCVNFLPLRARFSEGETFAGLLGQTKRTLLDAYEHQNYTYGTLIRKLSIRRDPSRLPLMDVQFNLERVGGGLKLHGLTASVDPNPKAAVNFDLFFNVVESEHGLTIDCDYNTSLFDEATIARWLAHYENLLVSAASDLDQPVAMLPLMTVDEERAMLDNWCRAREQYAPSSCLHELVERQAARAPGAVAVVYGNASLTYAELNSKANQLAHYLRRQGVKPDSLVGICLTPSLEMIVGLLGVLKAGGAYVPLDPANPAERLRLVLEEIDPPALIAQRAHLDRLAGYEQSTVCLDRDWPVIALESERDPSNQTQPERAAYVIYTSGSTGRPKGVVVTHHNAVRLFQATQAWFSFSPSDVWTLFHSYAFDFSVWEIWGALVHGGRLVVVPFDITRSPEEFHRLLARERVTVLNQTPSAFYALVQAEDSAPVGETLSLRTVIFGGEALNFSKLKPWFARHGDSSPRLVNMFGITETTVHVTYRPLTAADSGRGPASLIGRAIPDLELYLLDANLRPAPIGVAGEIYVGGAGVARGYLNRPELTAERFVHSPFSNIPGARLYRSGDIARFLANGDVEYLGRADHQVKIRGYRIELGEIESALLTHPEIRQAVAMVREDQPGDRRLVACLVPKNGSRQGSAELRTYLGTRLPDHMVPSAFVFLDALPLTVNGKVDVKALPAPDPGQLRGKDFMPPFSPDEKLLCGIWAEVLRLDRVGVTDSLFELGGDSLHVFQIVARAGKAGLALSPRDLLEHRTIASILKAVAGRPPGGRSISSAIVPASRDRYRVGTAKL